MDKITHEEEVPYFASRPNVNPVDPRNRNTTTPDTMEDSRNGSPFDISGDSTHPESPHYIPISTINTTDSIDPTTAEIEPRRSKPPEIPPGRCGGHCPRRYVLAIVSAACLIAATGSVQVTMKYIQSKIRNGTRIDEKFSALAERLDYGHYVTLLLFLIPSGFLAVTHPPHRLFEIGITLSSLLTVLLPTIMKLDASYVVLTMVVIFQGFLESLTWPALHSLWQYWTTPTERSIIVSISISCIYSGRFLADIIWGKLVIYDLTAYSWYFFGFAGLVLAMIWHVVAREAPTKQRHRIRFNNPSNIFTRKITYVNLNNPKLNTIPYCSLLSSASVWAIILATIGQYWVEGFFMVLAPHFRIEMNDNMSEYYELLQLTLISLGTLLGGGISATLLCCCTKLSVTHVRKMATSIPLFICALAIIGVETNGRLVVNISNVNIF